MSKYAEQKAAMICEALVLPENEVALMIASAIDEACEAQRKACAEAVLNCSVDGAAELALLSYVHSAVLAARIEEVKDET